MSTLNVADAAYGSDKNGLICGFIFAPGQPARPIDSDEAALMLARAGESNREWFLWLHFSLSNTASERWLQGHLNLPEAFTDSLRQTSASTRIEQAGNSLVAVINDVVFDSSFEASDVSSVI